MSMDAQRKEWDELEEWQRNCLMWPDFLVWGQSRNVEIRRKDPNDSIGLVSVAVQDQERNVWYNIAKRIKDNHPAHGHVNPYEWIFKVDGTTTTDYASHPFSTLVGNDKNVVCLTLRKADDSLAKFTKKWGAEKTVTLKLSKETDFQKRCRLVHFYSKEDNENIKDRILVWEVKPGTETSEPLHRGDELLAVNDQLLVEEKKLAEIYKLIIGKAPADVKLKIKEIQHNICGNMCNEGTAPGCVVKPPECERQLRTPDISICEESRSVGIDNPMQCIVVEKETDMNAGRKESEVHINRSVSRDLLEDTSHQPSEPETTGEPQGEADTTDVTKPIQEITKTKRPKRWSLRSKSFQSDVTQSENAGYSPTPPTTPLTSRKTSDMCGQCNSETKLPADRNEWPIDKIELGCWEEICDQLDLDDRSKKSLLVALGCFTSNAAASIKKQFEPKGGKGMAKKALGIWGTIDRTHNVGALKEILSSMPRVDVLRVIENWEKLSVCNGCGIKLKKPQ